MPILKNIGQHKLLLDTHVWIWFLIDDNALSTAFKKAVQRCCSRDNVYVAPISIWELGMLVETKRIHIEMDCLDWVEQAFAIPGIQQAPFSPRIAIQSSRLPGTVHGDSADRILIATAREINAVLVTHDKKLLQYGKERFIGVHDPC